MMRHEHQGIQAKAVEAVCPCNGSGPKQQTLTTVTVCQMSHTMDNRHPCSSILSGTTCKEVISYEAPAESHSLHST